MLPLLLRVNITVSLLKVGLPISIRNKVCAPKVHVVYFKWIQMQISRKGW
jgi:hypothetical protein